MNIDIEALRNMDQAIDPVIEAEDFKRQGNDALKKGNQYRVAAIKLYTRAIKCNVADEKKRSVYFANRAHANLIGGESTVLYIQLRTNNFFNRELR